MGNGITFFRIEFRRAEREKKLERMAEERQRRDMEKEKLQDRLEELRKQVRVEAPRDPERTQKATVASEYRTGQVANVSETSYEPVNTQMFSVNTFSGTFNSTSKNGQEFFLTV